MLQILFASDVTLHSNSLILLHQLQATGHKKQLLELNVRSSQRDLIPAAFTNMGWPDFPVQCTFWLIVTYIPSACTS